MASPYIDQTLQQLGEAQNLFLHLGYWPAPAASTGTHDDLLQAQVRLNDELLRLAELADGQAVLDAGCGLGGTLAGLQSRGLSLTGLNVDPRQLDIARRAAPAITWVQGDACRLPFPSASFDRLLAIECVFHFSSRDQFFREAARVLRPGGLLVLSDFVATAKGRAFGLTPSGFAIESVMAAGSGPWPDLWNREGEPEALAAANGLRLVQQFDATAHVLPSYRCITPRPLNAAKMRPVHFDAVEQSILLQEWLLCEELVQMQFLSFERPSER